tara:strand:- start:3304 stop:3921 length:618 start_codon:yes stop_codon:yes gene_type:complete
MIVVVDYGMGNLGSVKNMLAHISSKKVLISSDIKDIGNASKIILPGVGSFKKAMLNLKKRDFIPILEQKILNEKIPLMGICLGMQLLFESSEEGNFNGLGWVKGKVTKFNFENQNNNLKIPHMGWNFVKLIKESNYTKNVFDKNKYYFVHTYHVNCKDNSDILMTSNYGIEFVSAIEKGNISGFQFHPEKSHKYGMKIFKNFVDL